MAYHIAKTAGVAFSLALLLLITIGVFSYITMTALSAFNVERVRSRNAIIDVEATLSLIKDAETGQRGFLLTGDDRYLQPFDVAMVQTQPTIHSLVANLGDKPEMRRQLETLSSLVIQKQRELQKTIDLCKVQRRADALRLVQTNEGKELMDEIRATAALMRAAASDHLSRNDLQINSRVRTLTILVIVGNVLAALLGALAGGFFLRDIGMRVRFERDLREKNAELERARLAKDRFLASTSHELRTPLNAIIGFTGTLLMRLPGPLTADQEKQLQTVQTSAKHLLSLINDLLDMAKIESGKVVLHLEPIVLQGVLEEVAASLHPLAERKGLRFEVSTPGHDVVLRTDRRALSQILINLANNAIKFTQTGRVSLELDQRQAGAKILTAIRVIDTGIGIRPEDRARLFREFEQVDRATDQRPEGTGLGLHLSQKLAELLGGRITVQSEYGRGSTFTLTWTEEQ